MTTPRAELCNLVDASATFTGKPVWSVWEKLYAAFEDKKNTAYRRMAYVAEMTNLDLIDQEYAMPELYLFAKGFLKLPALPEKEKAPVQGSLLEGGLL